MKSTKLTQMTIVVPVVRATSRKKLLSREFFVHLLPRMPFPDLMADETVGTGRMSLRLVPRRHLAEATSRRHTLQAKLQPASQRSWATQAETSWNIARFPEERQRRRPRACHLNHPTSYYSDDGK